MRVPLIEVCVEGVDDAVAAAAAGADRIELCASLMEGGLTPSLGVLRAALERVAVPVHAMIRPRGGDFAYSPAELDAMTQDVRDAVAAGAAGVVFGCLTLDGAVDEDATSRLVAAARPAATTFHRAFDMTADPGAALEALVRCGVDRVLTSGQRPAATEGLDLLARLARQAAGRIIVLGCGELDETNIAAVAARAGLTELHFAALRTEPSPMRFRNASVAMGSADQLREYQRTGTDPARVRAIIAASRSGAS